MVIMLLWLYRGMFGLPYIILRSTLLALCWYRHRRLGHGNKLIQLCIWNRLVFPLLSGVVACVGITNPVSKDAPSIQVREGSSPNQGTRRSDILFRDNFSNSCLSWVCSPTYRNVCLCINEAMLFCRDRAHRHSIAAMCRCSDTGTKASKSNNTH